MRTVACTRASRPCSAGRPVQPAHRCHALVSISSSQQQQQQLLQQHSDRTALPVRNVQSGRARLHGVSCRAQPEGTPTTAEGQDVSAAATTQVEDFDGLAPEEDAEVPGTYADALNGNTKLGKAIRAACSELEHLNEMELEVMQQAEALLKKLGVKAPIVEPLPQEQVEDEEEQEPQV